ncbi:Uncharacterized membrane protein [Pseudobacteriovorax antillogorgiicola]|uniref:Uncharacterized membrane protein n=1 Tax=Pseudobacteriovorax antillogorgiicola TaxID=1513793 RepID=A0A1Y6CTI7_9BACT|nr:putative membrane protein [Pseudobacteriovorax antillogorgiicola]SMF75829.1 Uncharacterized membrane protein [Pseudobacteriovorax antillogorgiicola]
MDKGYLNICLVFFVCYGFFGTGISLLIPPLQGPDEATHWISAVYRASSKVDGRVCSKELDLPAYFEFKTVAFQSHKKLKSNIYSQASTDRPSKCITTDPANYGNSFTYLAVWLAKVLVPDEESSIRKAIVSFHLARIINGFVILSALLFLLYSVTPGRSLGLLFVAFIVQSPLFIQQTFTISSDWIIILTSLLVLIRCFSRKPLGFLFFSLFSIISVGAILTKPVILPLLMLPLLFPIKDEAAFTYKNLKVTYNHIAALVQCFAFLAYVATIFTNSDEFTDSGNISGLDPIAQLRFILFHFDVACTAIYRGIVDWITWDKFLGPLGWVDVFFAKTTLRYWSELTQGVLYIEGLILTITAYNARRLKFSRTRLLLGCLLVFGSFIAVPFAMYLLVTVPGSNFVNGLQTRYYFPSIIASMAIFQLFPLECEDESVELSLTQETILWVITLIPLGFLLRFYAFVWIDVLWRYR